MCVLGIHKDNLEVSKVSIIAFGIQTYMNLITIILLKITNKIIFNLYPKL